MLKKQEGLDLLENIGKNSSVFVWEFPVLFRELAMQKIHTWLRMKPFRMLWLKHWLKTN